MAPMTSLIGAFAFRLRQARRALLCRWRNRFPLSPREEERAVIELHRKQKQDYAGLAAAAPDPARLRESHRREAEARLALLDRSYSRCLEIGCENGWFGRMLRERGTADKVIGVDFREGGLRGHSGGGVALLAASAERLPMRSGRFDLVAAFHVLEHIRDPDALRRELDRLAAPGAHVILAVPLGWDEDPCHRWHFMSPRGWRGFLEDRFGLEFLKGGIHPGPADEFLALFKLTR